MSTRPQVLLWQAGRVDKAALRARLKAARGLRSESEHRTAASTLGHHLDVVLEDLADGLRPIAGYLPMTGEPDPLVAMAAHHRRGGTVVVPRILPDKHLGWVAWSPQTRVHTGEFGVPEPLGTTRDHLPTQTAVIVTPALAVTPAGGRLGQGGGYYDRLLARLPRWPLGPARVAVVFDEEVLAAEELPLDGHDQAIDAVVTPTQTIRCR